MIRKEQTNNEYGFRVGQKTYKTIADIPRQLPKDAIIYALGPIHDARTKPYIKEKA
jgi:hypothetical protein